MMEPLALRASEGNEPGEEYRRRIRQAMEHAEQRIKEGISLRDLARAACFSNFHFHRIFQAMTGETPRGFVARLRMEAAAQLLFTRRDLTLAEIAQEVGIASDAQFSRAFRQHFGVAPSGFLARHRQELHPVVVAAAGPEDSALQDKICLEAWPRRSILTYQAVGRYREAAIEAWEGLFAGLREAGVSPQGTVRVGMPLDNPGVTPDARCRFRAGVVLDEAPPSRLRRMELPAGQYAVLPFEGRADDIACAYQRLYGRWLPASGLVPRDIPAIEWYGLEHRPDPVSGRFSYRIALAVRSLRRGVPKRR